MIPGRSRPGIVLGATTPMPTLRARPGRKFEG
jgi:hypothetical protein